MIRPSYEIYAKMMLEDFQRSTRFWYYSEMPPPPWYVRAWRRAKARGRWPFERLRDALVRWLGCDCDR